MADGGLACDEKLASLRIEPDVELVRTRETSGDLLGRPFSMNDLEVALASFAGRIDPGSDRVRFYYATHL